MANRLVPLYSASPHGQTPAADTQAHAAATAAAAQGHTQVFKDWSVACNNIRHCEATGAQPDNSTSEPVVLWLARDAGPATPLKARLLVLREGVGAARPLTLQIGSWVLRGLQADAEPS
jgi:hypothetical protein